MFPFKVLLLFITFNWCYSKETVKVSLYYEALCPYCQDFVANQLYPGYQTLGDSLELELVPYGKAKQTKVHKKWQLTCQHGPKECYANKIQACALNSNYTQEATMNFIGCIMDSGAPEKNSKAKKCAKKTKLSWKSIKKCANGVEGKELLAGYGNVTDSLNPALEHVPYILFNDKYNSTVEDAARSNFLSTACSIFSDPPNGC